MRSTCFTTKQQVCRCLAYSLTICQLLQQTVTSHESNKFVLPWVVIKMNLVTYGEPYNLPAISYWQRTRLRRGVILPSLIHFVRQKNILYLFSAILNFVTNISEIEDFALKSLLRITTGFGNTWWSVIFLALTHLEWSSQNTNVNPIKSGIQVKEACTCKKPT